jgi:enoyl-[acyl-carrier protein] reductase I
MTFLTGKKILITGLLSSKSIAYGVAKACHTMGASLAFSYVDDKFKERVQKLAADFNSDILVKCDVSKDNEITSLFSDLAQHSGWDKFDGFLHSIAYAPKEAIAGDFLEGLSLEGYITAHHISAYSFAAMAKAAMPYLNTNSSLLTLSYLGSNKVIPNYNTMGLAKASLESAVIYTAESLGRLGIRVNAISAGPIKTLAASGIAGFSSILKAVEQSAPLRRNVTIENVGNVAAFLMSELAAGITAETIYVDAGFNAVGGMGGIGGVSGAG